MSLNKIYMLIIPIFTLLLNSKLKNPSAYSKFWFGVWEAPKHNQEVEATFPHIGPYSSAFSCKACSTLALSLLVVSAQAGSHPGTEVIQGSLSAATTTLVNFGQISKAFSGFFSGSLLSFSLPPPSF